MVFFNLVCVDGDIRLVGGPNTRFGRVEVCVSSMWGSVCGHLWDDADAQVVCRQLGFSEHGKTILLWSLACTVYIDFFPFSVAVAVTNSLYGESGQQILLDDVNCIGVETAILECAYDSDTSDCSHSDDAGVQCIGMFFYGILYTY